MKKYIFLILFVLSNSMSFGQKASLIQNVNFRAQDLKHNLNENGDTLLLASNKTIYQVDIYNNYYEKKLAVNRYKSNIPVNDLPEGRYVVEVKLSDRHIIMTLIRHETATEALALSDKNLQRFRVEDIVASDLSKGTIPLTTIESNEATKNEQTLVSDEDQNISLQSINTETHAEIKANDRNSAIKKHSYSPSALLNTRLKKPSERPNKYYWVVLEIVNGNSSSKTKKLVQGDLISGLISHNKAERMTARGRNNKLTIWEVYDTKKFMAALQFDRHYVTNASTSECFNPTPYYITPQSITSR
ncbi:hypothetical protein [Winogradskyella poriferorum]|uniref:hypothetical protein n=1 Tax=Winogradskyella poriferorum TaxID=307627 RepID=UPI003D655944